MPGSGISPDYIGSRHVTCRSPRPLGSPTLSHPFVMMRLMSEVLFFPTYAEVLEEVVRSAHATGEIDVECRPGLDPAVVASQLRQYSSQLGRPLRCVPRGDRVEVTPVRRAG
jgi:hypothetical protein